MRLSNSKIKTWNRCHRQFAFKYVEKLEPRKREEHLERGKWLHDLMMTHYDGQRPWVDRQRELVTQYMELFEEEREELGDLPAQTQRIFSSYLLHWADEDKGIKVIDSELDETVELPNGDTFQFIIDLIVEERGGGLWIWDHKTVGKFMSPEFMLIDAQLARYFWGAKKLGFNIRGVLFNELITKPPTMPKELQSGELERRKNLHCDVYTYTRELKRLKLDPRGYEEYLRFLAARSDQWFRRTRLPRDPALVKRMMQELLMVGREIKAAESKGYYPRSPDKSCTWGCSYLDLCQIDLFGGSYEEAARIKFQPRDRED